MKVKKRYLTLLEIMIVIFLIGVIGGVVGVNIKGSLDKAKVFRTKQAISQVHDALLLEVAKGHPLEKVCNEAENFLDNSPMIKDSKKILVDGWGHRLKIEPVITQNDIKVTSSGLQGYKTQKKAKARAKVRRDEEQKKQEPLE